MARSKEPQKGKAGDGKICSTCPGTGEIIVRVSASIKIDKESVGYNEVTLKKCPECKGKGDWRGKR